MYTLQPFLQSEESGVHHLKQLKELMVGNKGAKPHDRAKP